MGNSPQRAAGLASRRAQRAAQGGGIPTNPQPWQMTYDQFQHYQVPGLTGDSSRSPADIEGLRGEGGLLSDYVGDRYALNDWLGKGYDSRYDVSYLADAVRRGEPIKVYRASIAGDEHLIWPGAYVTPSRAYAVDHGEGNLGGARYVIRSVMAHPDELVAMNPNEFFYVPHDLHAWHERAVRFAVRQGFDVPAAVRAEYGL